MYKKVYLLCYKAEYDLCVNYLDADEVLKISNKYDFKLLRKLRKVKFDVAYSLVYGSYPYQNFYFNNIKADKRYCWDNSSNKDENTVKINTPNEIEDFLNSSEYSKFQYFLTQTDIPYISDLFYLKKFVKYNKDYNNIIFCVGASDVRRRMSVEKWKTLAKYLLENYNYDIFVCGTKNEEYFYDEISVVDKKRIKNFCGSTTVSELVDILGSSKLVIANDSGPGHIANSVGATGVIALGGGYKNRFFPCVDMEGNTANMRVISSHNKECWGCSWKGCQESFNCIENIDVNKIISYIKSIKL